MTTLACFCGGIIEGLAFLIFAAVTWVMSRVRLRRRSRSCSRACCTPRGEAARRSD